MYVDRRIIMKMGKLNAKQTTQKRRILIIYSKIYFMIILLLCCTKTSIYADEIYNQTIIDYFEEEIGTTVIGFAFIDVNGDGVADHHISIPYVNESGLSRRLSRLLKIGNTVSFDDSKKIYDREFGTYEINYKYLLEINGISLKIYFPQNKVDFPFEFARQERLINETKR
jgi:hypothetical protein